MANLSDMQIKGWIKNDVHFEGKADGNNGLYLCYREGFLIPVWRFRYRIAGKQRVMNIGNYRQLSLSDARKKAKELKAKVSLGYDVSSEKQERKIQAVAKIEALKTAYTVEQLADVFIEKMVIGRWKNASVIKSKIDKDIKGLLGQLAIEEVKPAHIDLMLQAIMKREAPTVANDMLRWCKRIFDYAIKRDVIQHNPAAAYTVSDAGGNETARVRVLSHNELILLFESMRNTNGFTQENFLMVKLLLLLAVRKSELIEAKQAEFDLDKAQWTLPAERTKTNTSIIIPLSPQAVQALQNLFRLAQGNEYLLPARKVQTHKKPFIHENTLNVALAKVKIIMDIPNFCIHDFRRTARSHLAALGIVPHIAERCLNHKIKGIEGVYNHHDYLEERRNALELWANLLTTCETGKAWNVTPIRKHTA